MNQQGCAVRDHLTGGLHVGDEWRRRESSQRRFGLSSRSVTRISLGDYRPCISSKLLYREKPREALTCSLTPQSRNQPNKAHIQGVIA